MKQKVIAIVGPTAVGKTALGIQLAKKLNGEIISGDSLQVYKQLNIGTAKATKEEQLQAKHHLIDIREIDENYSAADFQSLARLLIDDISSRGKLPIIVGGTGLYIQSLLEDYSLGGKKEKNNVRKIYSEYVQAHGKEALWRILEEKDPIAAQIIHSNNTRKIIRALEVFENTGKSIIHADGTDGLDLYQAKIIGLTTEREMLYQRINQRVESMIKKGLLDEAKLLYDNYSDAQAAQGIGYKEFFAYFDGEISLDVAVELVQKHSRNYAKRQMTWFRNRMNTQWVDSLNHSSIDRIINELEEWRMR